MTISRNELFRLVTHGSSGSPSSCHASMNTKFDYDTRCAKVAQGSSKVIKNKDIFGLKVPVSNRWFQAVQICKPGIRVVELRS